MSDTRSFESEEDLRRFFSFVCVLILIVATLGLAQSIIGPTFLNPAVHSRRYPGSQYSVSVGTNLWPSRLSTHFRLRQCRPFPGLSDCGLADLLGILRVSHPAHQAGPHSRLYHLGRCCRRFHHEHFPRCFHVERGNYARRHRAGFSGERLGVSAKPFAYLRAIQRTCLLIGMGLIILLTIFPEELGSRIAIYSETLMPDAPASELVNRTQIYPLKQLEYAFDHPRWPYGYGLGTCTLGGQYVIASCTRRPLERRRREWVWQLDRGTWSRRSHSLDCPWLLHCLSAWKVVTELRGTPWFPLAFAICLYAVILFLPMMFTGNSPYQDFRLECEPVVVARHSLSPQTVPESSPDRSGSSCRQGSELSCGSQSFLRSWTASMARNSASSSRSSALPASITGPSNCTRKESRTQRNSSGVPGRSPTHRIRLCGTKSPDIPGPHLLKYLWWFIANQWRRRCDRRSGTVRPDLVYSPGINCLDADVIVVHIVFHAFYERVRSELALSRAALFAAWPRLIHRKLYYKLIMSLERKNLPQPRPRLIAVSSLVAAQLKIILST